MAAEQHGHCLYLFGGELGWDSSGWVTSDDRVRGGSSTSHLAVSADHSAATFTGHLDTSTLGGAGFASQRTRGTLHLDLSPYDGLLIKVVEGDGKRYVVTLKDEIPERRDDGRDRSGVSWEADFQITGTVHAPQSLFLPWARFKPTYRGRPKPDANPLDRSDIKRVGLMMRSFFDEQDGDFSVTISSIAAVNCQTAEREQEEEGLNLQSGFDDNSEEAEEEAFHKEKRQRQNGAGVRDQMRRMRSGVEARSSQPWWKSVFCGLL